MNLRPAILLWFVLAAVSCDKVKSIAANASTAVKEKISRNAASGKASAQVDAELSKLVDQTAEGTVFRKDLPFPARLEVRTTSRHDLSGRFYQTSAIEKRTEGVKGTQLTITKLERTDGQVRYTREKSSFSLPLPNNPDGTKKPAAEAVEQLAPSIPPITFRQVGKTWQAGGHSDFRAAVLSKQLTPVFEQLLVENALAPRPLWFAKRRFKVGDELVVAGESMPMLLAGAAKGSFKLKLVSFEAVEGHPCGVFSVTGDYRRKQVPDFEGNLIDEDVTIQSGKIWFSLIYPVILKQEMDTIQSYKSGGQGGLVSRGQGARKVVETRAWKRLDP